MTVPVDAAYVTPSPYTLEAEDLGHGIYRDGVRIAAATPAHRPRFYDLSTADGTPYWKLALLHLNSLASTVFRHAPTGATMTNAASAASESRSPRATR